MRPSTVEGNPTLATYACALAGSVKLSAGGSVLVSVEAGTAPGLGKAIVMATDLVD